MLFPFANGQETISLDLEKAIGLGIENSKVLKSSQFEVKSKEEKLKSTQMLQLPDINFSGQYMQLFDTSMVKLKKGVRDMVIGNEAGENPGAPSITPNYLILGNANLSLPLFNGFKIRNLIKQSESEIKLAQFSVESQKEEVVFRIIQLYFALFKTQKSIEVLKENIVRAEQRVKDFKNFMDNGLLARNDYLRAQLQSSHVQLSLKEAETTYKNLNYQLNLLLGLSPSTIVGVSDVSPMDIFPTPDADLSDRKEIQSWEEKTKIDDAQIKIAKSNYYPSIALTGGYMALDIDQLATVTNATNVGIGISYNLASLFKNKSNVEQAKWQKQADLMQLEALIDKAKIEMNEAYNKYNLAIQKADVYKQALEQANESYRIVKDKYDNGLSDTDQLLEADIEQLQAQINQVIAEADIQLALYEYIYTQGKLTKSFNLQ